MYLSPHSVPSLTDSLSLTTSPVSAPRCCCCCWQASSHGASLSTSPRQPLVWGKIRQVLHHHCVENNINFYVKSGNRIQSRLSWGILFLFADHENVKWEHFSSPEQTSFLLSCSSWQDIPCHAKTSFLKEKKGLWFCHARSFLGHLDKAPHCRRATRVFRPVKVLIIPSQTLTSADKNLADIVGIWYPWRDAPVLFDIIYSLWTICGRRNIDFYSARQEIKWKFLIVICDRSSNCEFLSLQFLNLLGFVSA